MAEFQELTQALAWLITNKLQKQTDYTHGLLGDGSGRVRVSTTPGSPDVDYVFARPDRFSGRIFKVFNKRVEGQDGDPIIIGSLPWEPDLIQVLDVDWQAYADVGWGDNITNTSRHGITHQWQDGAPGLDTFDVYRRQFGDLKVYALESGTLNVGVSPYSLDIYGVQHQWPGTRGFSLGGAVPPATGTAQMALVYWSPASGTVGFLGVETGTVGSSADATLLNRPATPQGAIPSAFVKLRGGQTSITEFDIWDAREPFRPGISFGSGTAQLNASLIPIIDAVGFYTGTSVESALQETPYKLISPDGLINPVMSAFNSGDVGLGTSGPDAKLDILDTSGPQLRLTFEDGVKFADFELNTNEQLTITPSQTGTVIFQPTIDSEVFFQVLDVGGGTPILNIDSTNKRVGIGTATPAVPLDIDLQGIVANFGDGTDNAQITFNGGAGFVRDMLFRSGGSNRWIFRVNATAESGSEVGSDFLIQARKDDGSFHRNALFIQRSTGDAGLNTTSLSAQLTIDQSSTTAAQPVLKLDQGDISEQCIQFSSDSVDRDINLYTIDITDTPTMLWDQSAAGLNWNKGFLVADTFETNGERIRSVETHTGTGTMSDTVEKAKVDSASPFSLTLPGHKVDKEIEIKNIGAATVTLLPTSGLVRGSATEFVVTREDLMLLSDGTNWD